MHKADHAALDIGVQYATPRRGLPAAVSLRRWVGAALRAEQRRDHIELGIRIVGAAEGRALNRQYRARDYATNVLSFRADLPRGITPALIGDIVLCAPVIAREARQQHKPLRDHYAHLTIHGVLHLLGHDHEAAQDAAQMEALETRILAAMDVSDPYLPC